MRQFPIEVSVSLAPYDHRRDAPHRDGPRPRLALLIGCVDNPNARRELVRTLEPMSYGGGANIWWLDLGNSASSGQLYLGNAVRADALRGTFDSETGICRALPAPCIQAPELLEAPTAPLPITVEQDCAEAPIAGAQEQFVNRGIGALGQAMVARLCQRRLTWRATFFDLDAGTLHYIHADPHDIANLMGMRTDSVLRGQRALAREGSRANAASRPATWTQHAPAAHDPSSAGSKLGPANSPSSRTTTPEGSGRLGARRRVCRHPRQPGAGVLEGFRRARDRTLPASWPPRPSSEALLRAFLGAAIPTRVRPDQRGDLIVELAGGIQHEVWGENWQEWGDLWSLKLVFALSWALMEDPYDDELFEDDILDEEQRSPDRLCDELLPVYFPILFQVSRATAPNANNAALCASVRPITPVISRRS